MASVAFQRLAALGHGPALILSLMAVASCGVRSHEAPTLPAATASAPEPSRWPAIPFVTSFYHWDHHWFIWLPRHPLYESLEVMSNDPHGGALPLVWTFFTERAGTKHQVHYLNDPQVARYFGSDTYVRSFDYRVTGTPGGPRGLHLAFHDKNDRAVVWELDFQANAVLTDMGAGLTNQSGHSASSLFLVFFRERDALATTSRVLIGDDDLSYLPGPDVKYPFPPAYSSNVYVAAFSYTSIRCGLASSAYVCTSGRTFTRDASASVFTSNSVGWQNTITLYTDSAGGLTQYVHRAGEHVMRVDFSPPLPNPAEHAASRALNYAISIDRFDRLIAGTLTINGAPPEWGLAFAPEQPEWAKSYAFRSNLVFDRNGYALATSPSTSDRPPPHETANSAARAVGTSDSLPSSR